MAVAEPMVLDFTLLNRHNKMLSSSRKQLRARARRKQAKGKSPKVELEMLYKPIEEWDMEELARGRPRTVAGDFRGRPPTWCSQGLYEQAMDRFKQVVRENIQNEATGAIDVIHWLMNCQEHDHKGKPIVPPSVKLDCAKWLTEHIIGKPTQRIEADISVKLQAVLAQAMVGADDSPLRLPPVQPVLAAAMETSEGFWDAEADEDE